jgi:16S rRNA (cytosine967-C5)-methyltransferase
MCCGSASTRFSGSTAFPTTPPSTKQCELAKQNGFGPQAGFVNAVLRGYLREADETKKLLADLKISQPALGWSQPEWLVTRWQKRFGAEKTAQLLEWNNTPPKTFARANTLKTDAGKLIEKWREENVEYDFVRRDWLEENLIFELKSHPPLEFIGEFPRRLVLHPRPQHAARRL